MKPIRVLGTLLFVCALALLSSCVHVGTRGEHALTGKVWDVAAQRFVDPSTVVEHAAAARFVLLGEIHDNAEHHRIQARILEELLKRGRRPALVMEQYDVDQQDPLDTILREDAAPADKSRRLAELMPKGWDWPFYEPLTTLALQRNLPLAAANLSRNALRQVSRYGFSALGANAKARLALDTVWTHERQKQLIHDVYNSHCGKITGHVVEAIAKAQRARDAVMADTMLGFGEAVAIVGRGHARRDMGVPLYLAARAPDAAVLSLGLVEMDMPTDPAAYAHGPLGQLHDYIWFTPRTRRQADPCDSIPAPRPAAPGSAAADFIKGLPVDIRG